jgi:hypothetical protein
MIYFTKYIDTQGFGVLLDGWISIGLFSKLLVSLYID